MTDGRLLYRRWLDEVWAGRTDAAAEVVAADFVGHWPGTQVRGVDGLVAIVRSTYELFDELGFSLEVGPLVDGDLVAARWSGEGRRGEAVTRFVGHDLLRLRDGQVLEYWPATTVVQEAAAAAEGA